MFVLFLQIVVGLTTVFLCKRIPGRQLARLKTKPPGRKIAQPIRRPFQQVTLNQPSQQKAQKPKKTIKDLLVKKKSKTVKKKPPVAPPPPTKSAVKLGLDRTQISTQVSIQTTQKSKPRKPREVSKPRVRSRQVKRRTSRRSRRKKLVDDPEVGGKIDLKMIDGRADFPRINTRPDRSQQRSVRTAQPPKSTSIVPTPLDVNTVSVESQSISQKGASGGPDKQAAKSSKYVENV